MSEMPLAFAFDHNHGIAPRSFVQILGGKGAGLAEMTTVLRMPVPPGFTITIPVCKQFQIAGWPGRLTVEVNQQLYRLERRLGRRFGDANDPLLLAVRSGAAASMPGMLDTVLNLGLNPDTARGLAAASGDPEFAWDSYRRFLLMYANTVLDADISEPMVSGDAYTRAAAVQKAIMAAGIAVPYDPQEQLHGAIEAVFRSWDSPRAQSYRSREGIVGQLGTAVNVQAMVFGNYGADSGTGVVFTRNPSTGEDGPYGDFLPCAQGEDVVAGVAKTLDIAVLGEHIPGADLDLARHLGALERHYRDMCDVEFTVERGKLWILQTRVAKRGAVAAVRAAVRMVDDPAIKLSPAEAVTRVPKELRDAAREEILAAAEAGRVDAPIAHGLGASPGRASGLAVFSADAAADAADASDDPLILVRPETSPEDVHGMSVSVGIVTSRGGLVSHAAVVARGWGIPAVVGADALAIGADTAGDAAGAVLFRAGDLITIDGTTGEVWLGAAAEPAKEADAPSPDEVLAAALPELAVLEAWAAQA